MSDQGISDGEQSRRDVPSFIEPRPPLITNPFMRPRPQKGTNLLELFEDSELEEPDLVQVYLRLKPCDVPSHLYEVKDERSLITSVDTATAGHGRRTQHHVSKMYTFSHIFGPESSQKEIFERVVKDNLKKLPEGHNFTLLTYGASGSGKTYTLMGTTGSPGLVPRSLEYVFRIVDAAQQPLYKPSDTGADRLSHLDQDYQLQWVRQLQKAPAPLRDKYRRMSAQLRHDMTSTLDLANRTRYYVWVSFVEIYNESIYDLLSNSDRSKATSKLQIREDSSGNVYVKGATQAFVRTGEEAYDVMVAGKRNLQVAATGVHAHSSRSHCIFTITMLTETDGGVRTSYVRLCDLAGSERAHATRNTGARMVESRAINASLHVLERCLHMLRRKQRVDATLVPYRESKLTRLLGAGLSGARGEAISMVVTLNPAPAYAHESRHVLQLAAVARDIQINQTVAETCSTLQSSYNTTLETTSELMSLRADNERLQFELEQAQSRIRQLMESMEEKQQEDATAKYELVEKAKEITRAYYEGQLQLIRMEMEEMKEDYESRLKAAEIDQPPSVGVTPSRGLQKEVRQLITTIAILEEKLTDEKLARQRAEEEVQHLRACIDERDEKSDDNSGEGDIEKDEATESESEESDEQDSCDESLEPTFSKVDINRSRLLTKSLNNSRTVGDYVSLQQIGIEKVVDTQSNKCDRSTDDDDCLNETKRDHDSGLNTENDSVCEIARNDTFKDDEHNDTTLTDSLHSTEESHSKVVEVSCDSIHIDDSGKRCVSDSVYVTGESNNSHKFDETENRDHREVNVEPLADKNESKEYGIDTNTSERTDTKDTSKKSSLTRGTYFVRDFEGSNSSKVEKSKDTSQNSGRETYFVKDRDVLDVTGSSSSDASNKSSLTRGTYFVKESEAFDASKINKSNESQKSQSHCRETYFVKDKKGLDEIVNNPEETRDDNQNESLTETHKTSIEDIKAASKAVNKLLLNSKRQNQTSDVSLAQFEQLEQASKTNKSPEKVLSEAVFNMKLTKKKKAYFDDDLPSHPIKDIDLVTEKVQKCFDNVGGSIAEPVKSNNLDQNLDDDRSPSIVKEDVTNNFEASNIKKLLGESFTRPDSLLAHKVALPRKYDSMDMFEFDSPGLVKTKIDAEWSRKNESAKTNEQNDKSTPVKHISRNVDKAKEVNTNEPANNAIDFSKIIIKQERNDFDFIRPNTKKPKAGSILETCVEKPGVSKSNATSIVEGNCVANAVPIQTLQNAENKLKIKIERTSVSNHLKTDTPPESTNETETVSVKNNPRNTLDEFESLINDVSSNSTTDFEILVAENAPTEKLNEELQKKNAETDQQDADIAETRARDFKKAKYNLRLKHKLSQEKKYNLRRRHNLSYEKNDEDPQFSQSERKPQRTQMTKDANEEENEPDTTAKDITKLKDIVNLQKEFSDVTLNVPAFKKDLKDIPSPEKGEEENMPPSGIQSCPSKSVTRSRRKLFTPLAEPLEESLQASGSSNERVRVPRPSYHRPRARRKL